MLQREAGICLGWTPMENLVGQGCGFAGVPCGEGDVRKGIVPHSVLGTLTFFVLLLILVWAQHRCWAPNWSAVLAAAFWTLEGYRTPYEALVGGCADCIVHMGEEGSSDFNCPPPSCAQDPGHAGVLSLDTPFGRRSVGGIIFVAYVPQGVPVGKTIVATRQFVVTWTVIFSVGHCLFASLSEIAQSPWL